MMLRILLSCLIFLNAGLRPGIAQESEIFPPPPPEEAGPVTEPSEIPPPMPSAEPAAPAQPEGVSAPEVHQAAPAPPPAPAPRPKRLPPELARITVRFTNVPLSVFLKAITQQTRVNFIISEGLEDKKITAFLDEVTLEEALQVLLGIKGLSYEKIPGKTHTYLIAPRKEKAPRTITRIFELNYIPLRSIDLHGAEDRTHSASGIIIGGESAPSAAEAGQKTGGDLDILGIVKTLQSEHGNIAVDYRTNSLVVTDLPERFPQVEALIRDLDRPSPQLIIEAQIVEINSNGLQHLGLDYGGPSGELMRFVGPSRFTDYGIRDRGGDPAVLRDFWPRPFSGTGGAFQAPGGISIGAVDDTRGITYGVLSFNEFQILLRAIVIRARGRILSRPKVMTINNKPAEIRVTAEEAIGIVSISNQQGSAASAERYTTGLILRVTPQVNSDGFITMVVEPSLSRSVASAIAGFRDPVKRGIKSMVRVRNGSTVVLGGLMDTREEKVARKLPILGYVPILGWLFTSQRSSKVNTELAVFITPSLMGTQ